MANLFINLWHHKKLPDMAKYYNSILDTIGDTPLVKLNDIVSGVKATVLAKVETTNPGNSVKTAWH